MPSQILNFNAFSFFQLLLLLHFFLKIVQQPNILTQREKKTSIRTPMAGQFVEFHSNFEFQIRSFETYQFNEGISCEWMKMAHNNIGLEWKMQICPAGWNGIDSSEWRNSLVAFLHYYRGLHEKLEPVKYSVFMGDGDVSGRPWVVRSFQRQGSGFGPSRDFVNISGENAFEKLKEKGCHPGKRR